jgi:predicted dinucleotide-binding enzyme
VTTAIIGTGGLGSVIARQLAAGGETLCLSSADKQSAQTLAVQIGPAAVVAADNRGALPGAGPVVLALRFTVLKSVIAEIADSLDSKVVVESAANRSPEPAALFYVTDDDRAGQEVEQLIRTAGFEPVKAGGVEQSSRLEVGGDLHDLVIGPAQARSLIDRA